MRSKGQCGTFPDDPEAIAELARIGLRAGVDWLDVEACWETVGAGVMEELVDFARDRYPGTRILGRSLRLLFAGHRDGNKPYSLFAPLCLCVRVPHSYHVVGTYTSESDATKLFLRTYFEGRADATKVVVTAFDGTGETDSADIQRAMDAAKLPCPCVGICLGEAGQLSRVINRRFTPVTSDCLPFVAAPGQISAPHIMHMRRSLFLVPKKFYLLGNPISQSPSPDMHNAAFDRIGLPWHYDRFETDRVEDFAEQVLQSEDFGGASVTIPHKQSIMSFLDELTPAAQAVGAVNTIVVQREQGKRRLFGDNTDWLGILRPVRKELEDQGWEGSGAGLAATEVAVVVGAGGTAKAAVYAMRALGLAVIVVNRTPEKGQALADYFATVPSTGSWQGTQQSPPVGSIASLEDEAAFQAAVRKTTGASGPIAVRALVSTVPASAAFQAPDWLFQSVAVEAEGDVTSKGGEGLRTVFLDAVYKPPLTALIRQVRLLSISFPNLYLP